MSAVISCPRCLRQYEAGPSLDGMIGKCYACKARFSVSVPKLEGDAGEAIVFDSPLEPHYLYFREGCEALGRNVSTLLEASGLPVTPANIVDVVASLPRRPEDLMSEGWRRGPCYRAMWAVFGKHWESGGGGPYEDLAEYFFRSIPNRRPQAVEMLQSAFAGVLGGVRWADGSPGDGVPDGTRPRAGWRTPWSRRR